MTAAVLPQKKKQASMEQALADYIAHSLHWRPEEYRLETHGFSDDQRYLDVWAIHRDDEKRPITRLGGGKSVSLWVDPKTQQVVKLLHFQ